MKLIGRIMFALATLFCMAATYMAVIHYGKHANSLKAGNL